MDEHVTMEWIRGDIAERIPGAFAIAAKAMEVEPHRLAKAIAQGTLARADFFPILRGELRREFGMLPADIDAELST